MELQDILVAEDEPLIRILIEEALTDAGYAVCAVGNGDEAMELLDGAGHGFVGVVTDIRMPGSSNGWDVAHHARGRSPETAVIYISADSHADWSVHGVPESVFVQKPFAAAQIVAALSALLNKAS